MTIAASFTRGTSHFPETIPPSKTSPLNNELDPSVFFGIDLSIQEIFPPKIRQPAEDHQSPSPSKKPQISAHRLSYKSPIAPKISSPLLDEMAKLKTEVKYLEKFNDTWMDPINEFDKAQGFILRCGSYIHANLENLLHGLKHVLDSSRYSKYESIADFSDWLYAKFIVPSESAFFDLLKLAVDHKIDKDIKKLKKRYYTLETQIAPSSLESDKTSRTMRSILQRLDTLSQAILEDQESSINDLRKNSMKLTFNAIPLALVLVLSCSFQVIGKVCKSVGKIFKSIAEIRSIAHLFKQQNEWLSHLKPYIVVDKISEPAAIIEQAQLREKAKSFLGTLDKCKDLKEVKKEFMKHGVTLHLPQLFEEWRRLFQTKAFKRALVQSYYHRLGKHPSMTPNNIQTLLKKRQAEFLQKIDHALPFIEGHISACRDKTSLKAIIQYFSELNIQLNRLDPPIKDLSDWKTRCGKGEFQKSLAKLYVEHQETLAQLAEQATRQLLISHNNVEKRFLIFDIFSNIVSITAATIKLILAVGNPSEFIASILRQLVANLAKVFPFLERSALLFPEWSFKSVSLFLGIVKHFVGLYYKPHAYSLEGYHLSLKIRWIKFMMTIDSILSFMHKALVWSKIHLIEKGILGRKISTDEQQHRLAVIDNAAKQVSTHYKAQIGLLKERAEELSALDITANLFPNQGKGDTKVAAALKSGKIQAPRFKTIDPVKSLQEALLKGDLDYFPGTTRRFIGEQLGIQLQNENKEALAQSLNSLFYSNEIKFVSSFYENRASHLKS